MPSTFEDLEEGHNLALKELNIKGVNREKPKPAANNKGRSVRLKDIVAELMPDPFVTLDKSLRYRITRTYLERSGKETTEGSIVAAVSVYRREVEGKKSPIKSKALRGKRGPYQKRSRQPVQSDQCNCSCQACALHHPLKELQAVKNAIRSLSEES